MSAPMDDPRTGRLDRRELLRLAGLAVAALSTRCMARGRELGAEPLACSVPGTGPFPAPSNPAVTVPHLGGAPDTAEGWAIAALVDTVIPGASRDPMGSVGALDVGAAALFFDTSLFAHRFVPLLVLFLDSTANELRRGAAFATLPPSLREVALEHALDAEEMGFAVQLAKLAYYASPEAACHLGYPGPNPGYVDAPGFSFGRAITEEITSDGNFP